MTEQQQVLIVGGNLRQLESSFIKRLEKEAQLTFGWHWADLSPQTNNIPQRCALVVLIKDQISHTFHGKVITQAKKRDLPCISVSRKWSKAAPVLRAKGYLKPSKNRHGVKQADVALVAETLISDTLLEGKHPYMEVVNAELVRAFGNKGALTGSLYTDLLRKVSEARPPTDSSEPLPVERTPQEIRTEASQWAQILLTEHPSYLLNRRALLERIQQEAQARGESDTSLHEIMSGALRVMQDKWESKTEQELNSWIRSTRTHDEASWSNSRVSAVSKVLHRPKAKMVKKLQLKPPTKLKRKRKSLRKAQSREPDMFFRDFPGFLNKWWGASETEPNTSRDLFRFAMEDSLFSTRFNQEWASETEAFRWLTRVLTAQVGEDLPGGFLVKIVPPLKPKRKPPREFRLVKIDLLPMAPPPKAKQPQKESQKMVVARQLIQNWAMKYGRQKIEFKHLTQLLDEMNLANYKGYSSRGMRTAAGKLLTQTASGIEGLKIWKKREGHGGTLYYALKATPPEWGTLLDTPTWKEPERVPKTTWDDDPSAKPGAEKTQKVSPELPQTNVERALEGVCVAYENFYVVKAILEKAADEDSAVAAISKLLNLSPFQAFVIYQLKRPQKDAKKALPPKGMPPLPARLSTHTGSFEPEEGLLEALRVPYGWMISEDRKALVKDPEAQEVRTRIESLAKLGVSAMAILLVMETDNPSYRGRPWTMNNVTQILEDSHE